jgi:hypothetical protein
MMLFILSVLLVVCTAPALAGSPELPKGATVRIKISELDKEWQAGTMDISKEGCTIVWIPDARASGDRQEYGLLFLNALERQQGNLWIDVPVDPLMKKEPKRCQEGAD